MTTDLGDWRPRPNRIRHSWKCSRTAGIAQTTRRAPSGVIVEVDICLECEADDFSERMLDRLGGGDAA